MQDVNIHRDDRCTVEHRGQPTNGDELNLVASEHPKDVEEVSASHGLPEPSQEK